MSGQFAAYYRVSTDRQGESGLGIEAQQAAVRGYLGASMPIAEFTEIETGKRNDRPELERALALGPRMCLDELSFGGMLKRCGLLRGGRRCGGRDGVTPLLFAPRTELTLHRTNSFGNTSRF
jgi:Resolvase, N terminal domain